MEDMYVGELLVGQKPYEESGALHNHQVETENWIIIFTEQMKKVFPLDIQIQKAELEASLWVHLNVLKHSNKFGVDFQRCKSDALFVFMTIDGRRKGKRVVTTSKLSSPKLRGLKELDELVFMLYKDRDLVCSYVGLINEAKHYLLKCEGIEY